MATPQQIADLRVMIDQQDDAAPYTDVALSDRIDAITGVANKLQTVAAQVWAEKAATYSALVDVQEGSSRRALGSLQAQALKMATHYDTLLADAAANLTTARSSRTRQIVRP